MNYRSSYPSLVLLSYFRIHSPENLVLRLLNNILVSPAVAENGGDDIGGDDESNENSSNGSILTYSTILATGFVMGVIHVLSGPDHLSALATLAVGNTWKAFWLGVRWGLGHSTGLIVIAILFICMDDRIDLETISKYCSWIVGVFMVILGLYGMYTARRKYCEKIKKETVNQLHDNDVFKIDTGSQEENGKETKNQEEFGQVELATFKSNNINNSKNDTYNTSKKNQMKNNHNSSNEIQISSSNKKDETMVENESDTHQNKVSSEIKAQERWSISPEDDDEDLEGESQPLRFTGKSKGGDGLSSSFASNWFQFRTLLPGVSSQKGSHQTSFSSVPFQSPEHSPKSSEEEKKIMSNKDLKDSGEIQEEHQIVENNKFSLDEEIVVDLSILPVEDEKEAGDHYNDISSNNKDTCSSIDSSTFMASMSGSTPSTTEKERKTWKEKLNMDNPIMQRIIAFGIGIVHGIAGPGGILGVIPAVEYNNWVKSVFYLGTFCISSTFVMGLFAAIYGEITSKMASTTLIEYRLGIFSAFLSVAVGVTWIWLVAVHKLEEVFE